MTDMSRGSELWKRFKGAFEKQVGALSPQELINFWSTDPMRTASYENRILRGVADGLDLECVNERGGRKYLTIDAHFRPLAGWPRHPEVFLEYENKADTAKKMNEVDKLCKVRAPLKVLIVVARWPNAPLKEDWLNHIKESWRWLPESTETVYGFVVGEPNMLDLNSRKGLRFHFFSISPEGHESQEEEKFICSFDSQS